MVCHTPICDSCFELTHTNCQMIKLRKRLSGPVFAWRLVDVPNYEISYLKFLLELHPKSLMMAKYRHQPLPNADMSSSHRSFPAQEQKFPVPMWRTNAALGEYRGIVCFRILSPFQVFSISTPITSKQSQVHSSMLMTNTLGLIVAH